MRKRMISLAVMLCLLFATLAGRTGQVTFGDVYAVNESSRSVAVTVDVREFNLYDRQFRRLTNNRKKRVAVLCPNEKTVGELSRCYSYNETQEILSELRQGRPVVRAYASLYEPRHIRTYRVCATENTCRQLLSRECGGLLSYTDGTPSVRKVRFSVDARGRLLGGDMGTLTADEDFYSREGLALTLDERVQNIVCDACQCLPSGCALVMRVDDASVLACVTKPDASYLNKPFCQFPVGSVFKVIVAACALENQMDLPYCCTSSITVGDTVFSCQKQKAHGQQHLGEALANSCNCYFVNLALHLGAQRLLQTARDFGFDGQSVLYRGFAFDNAVLPDETSLRQKGELALFGFGQGQLTASPAAVCRALCTVAAGGQSREISLVRGETETDGSFHAYPAKPPRRVMQSEHAAALLQLLRGVVENGTGAAADVKRRSAGKTATAQTGRYEDGREVLDTWFAGVYPYDSPRYAVVILCENGTSGAQDCCPIFRTIVEKLDGM